MTSDEFCELGEALFGDGWRPPLARLLRVNLRTLQRWANGQNAIPEQIAAAVRGVHAALVDVWPRPG